MFRTITFFSITLVSIMIASLTNVASPTRTIIGGEYILPSGQTIEGDMNIYFAKVTIENGATINGHVNAFSSDLDIHGVVTKDVQTFESDTVLRGGCRVDGYFKETGLIHWVVLIPEIARLYW